MISNSSYHVGEATTDSVGAELNTIPRISKRMPIPSLIGKKHTIPNPTENKQAMDAPTHVEKREILSEKVKQVIKGMLGCDEMPVTNISVYISDRMHLNYSYLSDLFSSVNGITIEHYIIQKKIEKGSELLVNTDMEIGQIAKCLNYKSCTHFSAQFRAVTGYRPSNFRKLMKPGSGQQTESLAG